MLNKNNMETKLTTQNCIITCQNNGKKSEKTYTLIKQVILSVITVSCLSLYFMLLPMIKDFGLPNGARVIIEMSIVFVIVFIVLICILREELNEN